MTMCGITVPSGGWAEVLLAMIREFGEGFWGDGVRDWGSGTKVREKVREN
jgi:hypothetical protein